MQPAVAIASRSTTRTAYEHSFRTRDGIDLFYRRWPGAGQRAIVLLHRGHEHSGRFAHIVDELNLASVTFFAWDARAHGRSGGEQGATTTMSTFVQDLDEFIRHIESEHGIAPENIAVCAQSVGAVIAAAWVHDYAPPIAALVLAAPAFQVKLYVPFARLALAIWHKIAGDFYVTSYVKGRALTHDRERAASYRSDPLIKLRISARVLLDLYRTSARVIADAAAIRVPTQVLLSGSDWVIHNSQPRRFFERLGTEAKEIHTFAGFYHDTLGEKERDLPIERARLFLERRFSWPEHRTSLESADKSGFTQREYESLRKPLPFWSPKAISFAATKLFLRTAGRLSNGIRIGCETGFDSGSSLDYVYQNRPGGITPLGTLIDWFYLNSPGWRGIRVRKKLIEEMILDAAKRVKSDGQPVRIVDVAAGHGRYVIEAIAKLDPAPDHVLLRDFDSANVELGRQLITQKHLDARFDAGDAFDRASLANLDPRPTVAIISGLFELFPANDPVRETLAGLADAIEPGGCLIYTGQPWHPQLEFIARALNSHRHGEPWIMRRRTQEELDELVASAGFRKIDQRIDPEGMFTVSIAQRVG